MKLPVLNSSAALEHQVAAVKFFYAEHAGLLPQGYGSTKCNKDTGNMSTTYSSDAMNYGPINCLMAHEKAHQDFSGACCQRVKKCIDKNPMNPQSCRDAYNDWFDKDNTKAHDECFAYTKELECLKKELTKDLSEKQRELVIARGTSAQEKYEKYCGQASGFSPACPFDADGNIL